MAKQLQQKFQSKKMVSQTINPDLTGLTLSPSGENRTDQMAGLAAELPGETLTTNAGLSISDNQNQLKAGVRGPTLLEDHVYREKITHFDHERIPERVVHARGAAAHGIFQLYKPMGDYTKAGFLQDAAIETPVFVRFSTVQGSRGSADTARDIRGFAVRFYTQEGNFDLVGNNIPVFPIQDSIKFPDLIHAAKPEAHNEIPQASTAHDTFWDFISLMPESTHAIMWIMSDRGIPRSYADMEGFGVHTFRFINDEGVSSFVKFHWKPVAGVHSLVWDEAQKLGGKDPDFHRRQLWESIDQGNYPEYELGVQIVANEGEFEFDFDLLDSTKLIPESLVPVQMIGKMTLNRNPDNYFAETEQVAFHLGNIVPGIDFTNDPLLQGRLFSYIDTQINRFGSANYHELPINQPIADISNNQRDGFMRHSIVKGRVNYEPNSLGGGCPMQKMMQEGGFTTYPEPVEGTKIRQRSPTFADHFSQAALFWRSQADWEKDHIVNAFLFELGKVEIVAIRQRMVSSLTQVDAVLAQRVADGLGMVLPAPPIGHKVVPYTAKPEMDEKLSLANNLNKSIKGRKIAILATNMVDGKVLELACTTLESEGACVKIIAPILGDITSIEGKLIVVDHSLPTVSSTQFDAVFIAGGMESVKTLCTNSFAVLFVKEAYKHGKPIGAADDGVLLIEKAGRTSGAPNDTFSDIGIVTASEDEVDADFMEQFVSIVAMHRFNERPDLEAISV